MSTSSNSTLDELLAQKRKNQSGITDDKPLVLNKTKVTVPQNATPSGYYFNEENSYMPIRPFNPHTSIPENKSVTQQNNITIEYRKTKGNDILQKLAIAPKLKEIVDNIKQVQNNIISISAPTGSGKSLGIPAEIYLSERNKTDLRIIIGEPTRVATYNLFEQENKILTGHNVLGFAAENTVEYNDNTKVIYMTMGHLKNMLYRFFVKGKIITDLTNIANYIMLDESHTQSLEISIILSLINLVRNLGNEIPKIVLLSATPSDNLIDVDSNITIKMTSSYQIDKKYHERNYELNDRQLYLDAGHKALQLHNSLPISAGDILVFAPGKSEILLVNQILQKATNDDIKIYLISGEKSQQIINDIYKTTKERKIIVATNLLESAITIDNLGIIIDTLTEKLSETSYNGGIRLAVNNISKSSADQRAGRTGRTRDGIVYRMCTTDFYENLPDFRIPEIKRVPLHNAIIELYAHGLPSSTLIGAENSSIKYSDKILTELDMVKQEDNKYSATAAGIFASIMPLKVNISRFLWQWLQTFPKRAYEGIVIANLMEYGSSFFNIPFKDEGESYRNYITRLDNYKKEHFSNFIKDDDLLVMITVFNFIYDRKGLNPKNFKNLKTISTEGGFIYRKTRELIMNIKNCVNILFKRIDTINRMKSISLAFLQKDNLKVTKLTDTVYDDTRYILNVIPENKTPSTEVKKLAFQNRIVTFNSSSRRYSDYKGKSYSLDARNTLSTLSLKQPRKLLMIDTFTIQNGRTSTNNISFAILVDKTVADNTKIESKKINDIQKLLKNFTISEDVTPKTTNTTMWKKKNTPVEKEDIEENIHYLLLDEDVQSLINKYAAQHLLINDLLNTFKDEDIYDSFKYYLRNYLLQLRFDNQDTNDIIYANTNDAYDKWINNIKEFYDEDYANTFQEQWQEQVLNMLEENIEIDNITFTKNKNNYTYKLKTIDEREIIIDVNNSFYKRVLVINDKNERKAQQQSLLLSLAYNMLQLEDIQLKDNTVSQLADIFDTLINPMPQNTFTNFERNSVGFFPLLEENFISQKSYRRVIFLPEAPDLIDSYVKLANKYLKRDRDVLFIFQKSSTEYYNTKNAILYQSKIKEIKIDSKNQPLENALQFLLFSNDENLQQSIANMLN